MLMYVQQDIFKSPAQVIVNTVNTVGVMGKGIAKRYKEIYPDMYKQYQKFCEQHLLDIGKLWIYKSDTKWILNFPTKSIGEIHPKSSISNKVSRNLWKYMRKKM